MQNPNKLPNPQSLESGTDASTDIYSKQSVILYFNYGKEDDEPFYDLSLKLCQLIEESQLGLYDGHEIAIDNSDGSFYIYGESAEAIFKHIKPHLEEVDFMKGAIAHLRFGPAGKDVPEIEIEI